VRLVVNASTGAVVQQLDYDEFGNVQATSFDTTCAPTAQYFPFQPFGFAGGLQDRDTGLVRFGARDYDPQVGRWIGKDLSRFAGGLNLYEYAGDDPINKVDRSGRNVNVLVWGLGTILCPECDAVALVGGIVAGGFVLGYAILNSEPGAQDPGGGGNCPVDPQPPDISDFNDPANPPGDDWEWRGPDAPGGPNGGWYNPETGETLHPDLDHGPPQGPHWDWIDPLGNGWRIGPDGTVTPK
jgi:RHS repeat-associated protein